MDEDLKKYLDGMKAELKGDINGLKVELKGDINGLKAEFKSGMTGLEAKLIEQMRDMQTELLRGFEAFSSAQTIRLRKVEVDQSNLDSSLSGRVNILETRLTQIEQRLWKH